jgi:deoxyribodipyrimidine photo-lyase
LQAAVVDYSDARNLPGIRGTSRLSPHLHFGEIGPRQIWHIASQWRGSHFMAEVGWREFGYHLLYHFPRTPTEPLRGEYTRFEWREDAQALEAWRRGRTGVPMVDAGMRELWRRVGSAQPSPDVIVASFLRQKFTPALAARRTLVLGHLGRCGSSRATRSGGNGPQAAVPMPRPTFGCSIR